MSSSAAAFFLQEKAIKEKEVAKLEEVCVTVIEDTPLVAMKMCY